MLPLQGRTLARSGALVLISGLVIRQKSHGGGQRDITLFMPQSLPTVIFIGSFLFRGVLRSQVIPSLGTFP